MKIFNNIKQIKTTILGLVFIGVGLYTQYQLLKDNVNDDNYFVYGLLITGLLLVIAPDDLIGMIKKIINFKTGNNNSENNNNENKNI